MRYLPLTEADRSAMLTTIGVPSVEALFAEIPTAARLDGPLDLPRAQGELEVERAIGANGSAQRFGRFGTVLYRRRRLSAPCPGRSRSLDPARRVPDLVHALPA